MRTFPTTGSLDELGRLLHEDDPAAQLALSLARLEEALAGSGSAMSEITALRVLTTDAGALARVYDVLTERLSAIGSDPVVRVETVTELPVAGMVVALEAGLPD